MMAVSFSPAWHLASTACWLVGAATHLKRLISMRASGPASLSAPASTPNKSASLSLPAPSSLASLPTTGAIPCAMPKSCSSNKVPLTARELSATSTKPPPTIRAAIASLIFCPALTPSRSSPVPGTPRMLLRFSYKPLLTFNPSLPPALRLNPALRKRLTPALLRTPPSLHSLNFSTSFTPSPFFPAPQVLPTPVALLWLLVLRKPPISSFTPCLPSIFACASPSSLRRRWCRTRVERKLPLKRIRLQLSSCHFTSVTTRIKSSLFAMKLPPALLSYLKFRREKLIWSQCP